MKTKIFTLLFAIVVSIGNVSAEIIKRVQIGDLYYNLNTSTKTAEVTYQSRSDGGDYNRSWNIETAIIPSSVTYNAQTYTVTRIGDDAFSHCSNLTSVEIPNSVTSIGNCAFQYCRGLTSVTIPNSVTSIEYCAFQGCSGLTSVTIPNSVTSIGNSAFEGCSSLTSLTIPNSVTSIEHNTFYYCSGLTSVTIPNSVTSIGDEAFDGCSGLTSVTIPNSVTSIGWWAFSDCTGLASVTIGNSVTSIGNRAFANCSGLTSVHISDLTAWCAINFENNSTNPLCYAHNLYLNETLVTDLIIPNDVTSIGNYAFQDCSGLTSVTIPNSVTSIRNYAFQNCSSLTSVTIPNSVTSIEVYAFAGCSGLTSLSVEAWNKVYDSRNNCNAIIKTFTNTLILGCQKTTIPNSVTSIGYGAFQDCRGLTSVTIPNSVTWIEGEAFRECTGLTSVTIPNSVTWIGCEVFRECTGLTSVTIGNSVTSIGDWAFYGCSGLTSVTNYATTPQAIDSDVFYNVDKSTCVLNVLKESVSLYQAAEGWKEFTNIVGVDAPQGVEKVLSDKVKCSKLIKNGNVYILTDDKTYTITGQKVK